MLHVSTFKIQFFTWTPLGMDFILWISIDLKSRVYYNWVAPNTAQNHKFVIWWHQCGFFGGSSITAFIWCLLALSVQNMYHIYNILFLNNCTHSSCFKYETGVNYLGGGYELVSIVVYVISFIRFTCDWPSGKILFRPQYVLSGGRYSATLLRWLVCESIYCICTFTPTVALCLLAGQ